jgi:hypothetical protein
MRDTAQWVDHAIYANGGQVRTVRRIGRLLADHIDRAAALPRAGVVCSRAATTASTDGRGCASIEIRELAPRPRRPLASPSTSVRFRKHVLSHEFVSEGSLQATSTGRRRGPDRGRVLVRGAELARARVPAREAVLVHRGYSDSFINFALDVNRDGWLDVVRFDFPGRAAYWYENPQGAERDVDRARRSSRRGERVAADGETSTATAATICCSSMREARQSGVDASAAKGRRHGVDSATR